MSLLNYYDLAIKERRQAMLLQSSNFDVINNSKKKWFGYWPFSTGLVSH